MRGSVFISQGQEGDILDLLELRTFIVEEQLRQNTKRHRVSSWPFDGEIQIEQGFWYGNLPKATSYCLVRFKQRLSRLPEGLEADS